MCSDQGGQAARRLLGHLIYNEAFQKGEFPYELRGIAGTGEEEEEHPCL